MSTQREGLSLLEVVFALVILTLSVLAMAGSTTYVMNRMSVANARTGRLAAVQAASERVRSLDYDAVDTTCQSGETLVNGRYRVECRATDLGDLKRVLLISAGPGYESGSWNASVVDTATVSIAEPVT